eukprot:8724042-Pyramimonas_sp.AAC.1
MELLKAAGAPSEAVDMVSQVVDTCPVCRQWQGVGVRPMAKLKVLSDFNIEVEVDLLFWSTHTVLHLVDACIRWSAALIVASRVTQDILNGITHVWLRLYGPMKRLTSDKEGALDSEVASAWAD